MRTPSLTPPRPAGFQSTCRRENTFPIQPGIGGAGRKLPAPRRGETPGTTTTQDRAPSCSIARGRAGRNCSGDSTAAPLPARSSADDEKPGGSQKNQNRGKKTSAYPAQPRG